MASTWNPVQRARDALRQLREVTAWGSDEEDRSVVTDHTMEAMVDAAVTAGSDTANAMVSLERQMRRYEDLFERAPTAYIVTDAAGCIVCANQSARDLLDVRPGIAIVLRIDPVHREQFLDSLRRLVDTRQPRHRWTLQVRRPDEQRLVAVADVAVRNDEEDGRMEILWMLHNRTRDHLARERVRSAVTRQRERIEYLESIDAWKSVFLLGAAHDLHSPLHAITGGAKILLTHGTQVDAHQSEVILRSIVTGGGQLQALVERLLELHRTVDSCVDLVEEPTPMGALVRETTEGVLGNRPASLAIEEGPAILIDPVLVRQIVTNLLRNVLEHTPEGIPVWIHLRHHDDAVRLVVEDAGPGVPADTKDDVFRPFFSCATHSDDPGGTGIGLSLVRLFTELHGGTVAVSDRPGGGARFVITLPRRGPMAPGRGLAWRAG